MPEPPLSPLQLEIGGAFAELCSCLGVIAYRGHADQLRTLVEVTGSCERLTGHTPEDFTTGRVAFADLIHPEDREEVQSELGLALLDRRSFQLCYRIISAQGEVRWIWEVGSVVEDRETGGPLLRGWMFDTTSSPQTRTHGLVEGVVAGVAHDLRNLLAIIVSGSELLQRSLGESSPARAQVTELREVAESSSRLAAQLTSLVGHRPPSALPTSLNVVVKSLQPVLRALVGQSAELELELEAELETALVSPIQIERILLNLASNARRAMPGGGHLTVSTRNVEVTREQLLVGGWLLPGSYAVLSVSDTGTGISEEALRRAFERGLSAKGGSGLGLATVRQIAEERGGAVNAWSTPERGTTFEVYLPSCDDRGVSRNSLIRAR